MCSLSLRRFAAYALAIGATLALGSAAQAQPHHHDPHHDHHPGHDPGGYYPPPPGVHPGGGLHPPRYPGVPPHGRDVVGVHTDSEFVAFYSVGHGNHRDYFCVHQGHAPERIAFGTYAHVHDLAHGLKDIMNLFHEDLLANYRGNPGLETVDQELHEFLECVERLDHAAAENNIDNAIEELRHFNQDLLHLERDVRGWHRHHRQQIGRGGLLTKIFDAKVLIAHLANDLGTSLYATPHHPHGHQPLSPSPHHP